MTHVGSIPSPQCPPGYPILALAVAAWVVTLGMGNIVWRVSALILWGAQ